MIKLAMIAIQAQIESDSMSTKMISQVHDELVFEGPKTELTVLQSFVVDQMEKALPLSVPIVVDCGHGESWYEAH